MRLRRKLDAWSWALLALGVGCIGADFVAKRRLGHPIEGVAGRLLNSVGLVASAAGLVCCLFLLKLGLRSRDD